MVAIMYRTCPGYIEIAGRYIDKVPSRAVPLEMDHKTPGTVGLTAANSGLIVLIGTTGDIIDWMGNYGRWMLRDYTAQSDGSGGVPGFNVLVSECIYKEKRGGGKHGSRVVDPIGDALVTALKGFTGLLPTSSEIVEGIRAAGDIAEITKIMSGKKRKVSDERQVFFSLGYGVKKQRYKNKDGKYIWGVPFSKLADGVAAGLEDVNKRLGVSV